MALIIQIALGILLGYLLIEHRSRLGEWALVAGKVLLFLAGCAVAFVLAKYIATSVGNSLTVSPDWLSRQWVGVKRLALMVPLLIVLVLGAYGFYLMTRKLLSRWMRFSDDPLLYILLGTLNVLIIWPVDLFLRSHTVYGEAYRSADLWSRQNGYADSIGGLMAFSLTLWPWLIILPARKFGVDFSKEQRVAKDDARDVDKQDHRQGGI